MDLLEMLIFLYQTTFIYLYPVKTFFCSFPHVHMSNKPVFCTEEDTAAGSFVEEDTAAGSSLHDFSWDILCYRARNPCDQWWTVILVVMILRVTKTFVFEGNKIFCVETWSLAVLSCLPSAVVVTVLLPHCNTTVDQVGLGWDGERMRKIL